MFQLLPQLLLAQGEAPASDGGFFQFIPLVLMFGVFYLLLIRPASKQRKEHQELLNQLKKGDEVALNGGMYGRIVAIDDNVATIEISNNVKVRVLRDRIGGRWPKPKAADETASASK